jgi:hypothetical protein
MDSAAVEPYNGVVVGLDPADVYAGALYRNDNEWV